MSTSLTARGVRVGLPIAALAGLNASLTLSLPPTTPTGALWPNGCRAIVRDGSSHALANVSLEPLYVSDNATLDGLTHASISVPFAVPTNFGFGLRVDLTTNDTAAVLWSSPSPLWLWSLPAWVGWLFLMFLIGMCLERCK